MFPGPNFGVTMLTDFCAAVEEGVRERADEAGAREEGSGHVELAVTVLVVEDVRGTEHLRLGDEARTLSGIPFFERPRGVRDLRQPEELGRRAGEGLQPIANAHARRSVEVEREDVVEPAAVVPRVGDVKAVGRDTGHDLSKSNS